MKKSVDHSEINRLITEGKERGYLTYGEINDALPPNVVAPGQIDDLIHLFGENEIHIVDSVKKGEKLISEQEKKQKGGDTSDNNESSASRSENISIDDPVRMYLREMGTISLLTREGEVRIAKKIEAGENEVISAVANCPITISEIIALGAQVKDGAQNVFDIVQVNEPEDKKAELEKS
jgi:RNA polymerase primary sigma factor